MQKWASLILTIVLVLAMAVPAPAASGSHRLVSNAVVLMDADTGEILWQKNMHAKQYPASITKIMTALLVLESGVSGEVAVASKAAVALPKGYAHIALEAGDRITVEDALYAMMLPSANDAANVLAEHVGGTQSGFAAMMNQRARQIGAQNTNFVNANGMPDNKHYTTAYDMALITREALETPGFAAYFGATSYTLPSFNDQTEETEVSGYQYMLLPDKEEYHAAVIGGKIGYTREAGHTMSTVATANGKTLICVVLGSTRDGKYADTQALLDYGFSL